MVAAPEHPILSVGIVTPTYLPDLSRCELLVESVQRCCPQIPHRLIVDHCDRKHFRHLEPYASVVTSEDLLPNWLRRLPGRESLWVSNTLRPIRGWIMQQILKISAAIQCAEEVSIFCDSDVAFVRQFSADQIAHGQAVGLLDYAFTNDEVVRWTSTAASLLGLAAANQQVRGHVGNLICWRKENVRLMTDTIEQVHSHPWQAALAHAEDFSEYILYGLFVREVLGYDIAGHFPSSVPFVKASWGLDLTSDANLDAFFQKIDPENVAVMLHSKDQIEPSRYRTLLEHAWDSLG